MISIDALQNLMFVNGVIKEGYIWAIHNRFPLLCRINMENYQIDKTISLFSLVDETYRASGIFLSNEKLYITPFQGTSILTYDIVNEETGKISLDDLHRANAHAALSNDKIYLFPRNIKDEVIIYDLLECAIERHHLEGKHKEITDYSMIESLLVDNCIWSVLVGSDMLVRIDLSSLKYDVYELGNGYSFKDILYVNDRFWLLENNRIVIWDKQTNEQILIKIINNKETYCHLMEFRDEVLLIPLEGVTILKCDKKDYSIDELMIPLSEDNRVEGGSLFYRSGKYQNRIILYPNTVNGIYVHDINDECWKMHSLSLMGKKGVEEIIKRLPLLETRSKNLGQFMDMLNKTSHSFVKQEESCGKRIYQQI